MIESTYITLRKAAEILDTDLETLLIASSEERIQLYWLLNRLLRAELGYYEESDNPSLNEPPFFWVPVDYRKMHFKYIPLSSIEAAELLKRDSVPTKAFSLSDKNIDGHWWIRQTDWAIEDDGLSEEDLQVTKEIVYVKRMEIETIREKGVTPVFGSVRPPPPPSNRIPASEKLTRMNQAASRFWSNVDRSDRGTHPQNAMVSAWLIKHGFSQTLASKAATILRPEWAPTGRKPEE